MPKKGRTRLKPYTEGYLKEIWELFFLPMMGLRPKLISPKDWMNDLFCEKTRKIICVRTTRKFHMPGKLLVAPNIPVSGIGSRDINENSILWIRHDSTMPDRFDVETQGKGKTAQVFQLDEDEWDEIKNSIVKVKC